MDDPERQKEIERLGRVFSGAYPEGETPAADDGKRGVLAVVEDLEDSLHAATLCRYCRDNPADRCDDCHEDAIEEERSGAFAEGEAHGDGEARDEFESALQEFERRWKAVGDEAFAKGDTATDALVTRMLDDLNARLERFW